MWEDETMAENFSDNWDSDSEGVFVMQHSPRRDVFTAPQSSESRDAANMVASKNRPNTNFGTLSGDLQAKRYKPDRFASAAPISRHAGSRSESGVSDDDGKSTAQ